MGKRDFTSAKAKEALLKDKERCCGNCCWFYGECTDGWGQCICQNCDTDSMHCSDMCEDDYVSRQEMRHHMAVLLQYHRADEDMNYRFPGGDSLEEAVVFAYKYMKVFSKL